MTSEPVRLALVGCGRLAEAGYVPALSITSAVHLVGVVDPDRRRAGRVAELAGSAVVSSGDLPSMLDLVDVDAVVLASPAPTHVEDATVSVGAGLAVLVEKPPAPDAAGAARLVGLGPPVHVGFNRRFDTGARATRDDVPATGTIGLDLALQYRRASWNPVTVRDDVLLDLAPHLVDWTRWLAGQEIVRIAAPEVTPDRARLVVDTTRGRATLTAAADRYHAESIVVTDGSGAVLGRHRAGGPVAAVTGRITGRGRPHPLAASLAAQLDTFAAAVRGRAAPDLATAGDGHAAMVVIDAARASARNGGRPVDIDQTLEQTSC